MGRRQHRVQPPSIITRLGLPARTAATARAVKSCYTITPNTSEIPARAFSLGDEFGDWRLEASGYLRPVHHLARVTIRQYIVYVYLPHGSKTY